MAQPILNPPRVVAGIGPRSRRHGEAPGLTARAAGCRSSSASERWPGRWAGIPSQIANAAGIIVAHALLLCTGLPKFLVRNANSVDTFRLLRIICLHA
jgi:hypothetical protein